MEMRWYAEEKRAAGSPTALSVSLQSINHTLPLLLPPAFLQGLIEQVQNLTVGAAKLVGSPFFDRIHGVGIDTEHKAFIFGFFCHYKL